MTIRNIKTAFPNVKMAFVSTRTRSYSNNMASLNPEPYAYETGFGVKWMIEKQISGDPSLQFSGPNALAPYLCWGPYFWIDGQNRRSDGAIWNCNDLISDFTHPSFSGVYKVSSQLLAFQNRSDRDSLVFKENRGRTRTEGDTEWTDNHHDRNARPIQGAGQ
jgi:hypothetical protein